MDEEKRKKFNIFKLSGKTCIIINVVFVMLIFIAMIAHIVIFVANNEEEMINNSYNSRQEILLSRNYRGSILSRDKDVLAKTSFDEYDNESREYPYGEILSHIVGYADKGKAGVEYLGNYYLINTDIPLAQKVRNDTAGRKNPGNNVVTTLDVEIQKAADDQLGLYRGAIVVTEVKTGKILAMVSHPDFDPNEISNIWDDIINDETSSVLLNRATQGLYPPGSTFKIVTALEYYREYHSEGIDNYRFTCSGRYSKGASSISCYHGTVHGNVNFFSSFAKSCNSSFANIGMSLDRALFDQTLDDLLFNGELPLDIPYSKSSAYVSEDTSDSLMMQTSIGQGNTQMTPIHLNMITMAIANGGELMKPRVMDRIENANGSVIKTYENESYGFIITEDEAATLKSLMINVVESGTAPKLKNDNYTAAGKTGSAEYGNVKGDSHAWFTGFAPAEDPMVAVTVIVEGAGSGGDYAVPIAKRIFDEYFRQEGIIN
ncbi:MAG: penicillin-binding protein 2 [Lachnospiraceae bacterium]|nr:penicillin-binding protein 2 [Lachnospiraceae bacterium]